MPRRGPIAVRTTPACRGPAYGGSALRDVIAAPGPQAAASTAVTTTTAQGRRRRDDRTGTKRQPTDYRKATTAIRDRGDAAMRHMSKESPSTRQARGQTSTPIIDETSTIFADPTSYAD